MMINHAISTITLGGTITIVVVLVLFTIGIIPLFVWLTRRERRRYTASKVSLAVVIKPIEKLIKEELIKAKANTKFSITTLELDNLAEVKSEAGAKFVKELLEMAAGRAVRQYNYPILVGRYGGSRIVYIAERFSAKRDMKRLNKVKDALKESFINPEGGSIGAKFNISVINFPECGSEYSAILRSIEFAAADAIRNGGISVLPDFNGGTDGLEQYIKLKRALNDGGISAQYTPVRNSFNRECIGYYCKFVSDGETDYLNSGMDDGARAWLNERLLDTALSTLDKMAGVSGALIFLKFIGEISDDLRQRIRSAVNDKEIYARQLAVCAEGFSENFIEIDYGDEITFEEIKRRAPRYAFISDKRGDISELASALDSVDVSAVLIGESNAIQDIATSSSIDYVMAAGAGLVMTQADLNESLGAMMQ